MADDQGQQVPQVMQPNQPVSPAPLRPQGASAGQAAVADLEELTKNPVPEENLSEVAEEFEEKQKDFQAMYNAGGHFKEQVESVSREMHPKPVEHVVEIPTTPEVGPEMAGYMEKVEKEAELAGGVTDDYVQQALLQTGGQQAKPVTLPLNEEQIEQGLHHKVWEGIRWVAEWCVRQIKLFHGKVIWKH